MLKLANFNLFKNYNFIIFIFIALKICISLLPPNNPNNPNNSNVNPVYNNIQKPNARKAARRIIVLFNNLKKYPSFHNILNSKVEAKIDRLLEFLSGIEKSSQGRKVGNTEKNANMIVKIRNLYEAIQILRVKNMNNEQVENILLVPWNHGKCLEKQKKTGKYTIRIENNDENDESIINNSLKCLEENLRTLNSQ